MWSEQGAATGSGLGRGRATAVRSSNNPPRPWRRPVAHRAGRARQVIERPACCLFVRFDKREVVFTSFIHCALIIDALRSGNTP